MRINVNTFTKKKSMKFLNVNYVFDFMINIVANNILENKEMYFNTKHRHLYRKETQTFLVLVSKIDAHYVLEDNRSEEMSIFAVFVRKDIISKEVVEEIKLTNKNKMSLINKCEASESTLMLTSSNTSTKTNSKFSLFDTSNAFANHIASEYLTFSSTSATTSKKSIF